MLMSQLQDVDVMTPEVQNADVATPMLKKTEMPKNCCFELFSSSFHPRTINTHFLGF